MRLAIPRSPVARAVLAPLLLLTLGVDLVLGTAGCRGCHEDHPYVPYVIGPASPSASGAPSATAPSAAVEGTPSDAGEAFGVEAGEAVAAAAGVAQWSLDGLTLKAPEGTVFVLGRTGDFDGDGQRDAFAVVRPADGNDPGQAVYYHGEASAGAALPVSASFAPPSDLARDPSCTALGRLVQVGPHAVLVELGATCPVHPSRAASRWIAVLSSTPTPNVRLAATVADPDGSAAVSIDADVSDRDGDGREDVTLRVALEGGSAPLEPGARVTAMLGWLDRPAGLSRDTAVTESSFAALAATATGRAGKIKEAADVPRYAAQVRALWRATCADGGSPRIVASAGTGAIACGGARALEALGLAETRAYATLGDALRAALALDRAERPPASHTAARVAEAQKRWLFPIAAATTARMLRAVAAVPLAARGREPSWGPLAFEASGKLLIRTRAGVVRMDPDLGDETAADGVSWKPDVLSPDGTVRWIETYDPCDGLPLRATFELGSGSDARDVALPLSPPLGGRCTGARGAAARAVPIAWGPGGLEALVEGEPVLVASDLAHTSPLAAFLGQPWTAGAPRSPDGRTYVFATGSGLLVRGDGRARLLRASELDDSYGEQRDCAVSNDATHVACVRAGKAWVGTWDAL